MVCVSFSLWFGLCCRAVLVPFVCVVFRLGDVCVVLCSVCFVLFSGVCVGVLFVL